MTLMNLERLEQVMVILPCSFTLWLVLVTWPVGRSFSCDSLAALLELYNVFRGAI